MTSFIIAGKNWEKQEKEVKKIASRFHVNRFDLTIITREQTDGKAKQSLGIEDVKNMQKKLFLKPIESPAKAVVLKEAELLTIEAQNALLKVLEEPPDHTIIILTVDTLDALLPTIQSRCRIIQLPEEIVSIGDTEADEYKKLAENLTHQSIGESLRIAESLSKNKDGAILWLEKMIVVTRKELLNLAQKKTDPTNVDLSQQDKYLRILKSFQKFRILLKTTNVNLRLALENLFLSLG